MRRTMLAAAAAALACTSAATAAPVGSGISVIGGSGIDYTETGTGPGRVAKAACSYTGTVLNVVAVAQSAGPSSSISVGARCRMSSGAGTFGVSADDARSNSVIATEHAYNYAVPPALRPTMFCLHLTATWSGSAGFESVQGERCVSPGVRGFAGPIEVAVPLDL